MTLTASHLTTMASGLKHVTKLTFFVCLISPLLSSAHEYWLDPISSKVSLDAKLLVDIRNGENFSGASFPYEGTNYKSITINSAADTIPYTGRLGDYPAIHYMPASTGLHSVNLNTVKNKLVYDTWEHFADFLNYHGFADIEAKYKDASYTNTPISEHYYRSAKTYFDVSSSSKLKSTDIETNLKAVLAPTGSPFEMVLLENPYKTDTDLNVQILFNSTPLKDRQVEMFWKGSQLVRLTQNTNTNGVANFKLLGAGDYLFNAVQLVEPKTPNSHWTSYWASITFER